MRTRMSGVVDSARDASRKAASRYRAAQRSLRTPSSRRSRYGLDWLNFFLADVQTGFGTFVAFYLARLGWTQASIGSAGGGGLGQRARPDTGRRALRRDPLEARLGRNRHPDDRRGGADLGFLSHPALRLRRGNFARADRGHHHAGD